MLQPIWLYRNCIDKCVSLKISLTPFICFTKNDNLPRAVASKVNAFALNSNKSSLNTVDTQNFALL